MVDKKKKFLKREAADKLLSRKDKKKTRSQAETRSKLYGKDK